MNPTAVREAIRLAKRYLGKGQWQAALACLNEAKRPFCCHRLTCEQYALFRTLCDFEDMVRNVAR